jgi:hypothetical protein
MTWESKCDDPRCPGWAVFNETEIQRCDSCNRFSCDEEAFEHVVNTALYKDGVLTCDGHRFLVVELKGNAWILSKVVDGFEYPVKLYRADRGELPPTDFEALLEDAEYEVPQ